MNSIVSQSMDSDILHPQDVQIGEPIPWPLFDREGRLLLKQGAEITSTRQLDSLISRGATKGEPAAPAAQFGEVVTAKDVEDHATPFERFHELAERIPKTFDLIKNKNTELAQERLMALARDVHDLYLQDSDAMLAAVLLVHEYGYASVHPLHTAILCETVSNALDYDLKNRLNMLAAALTQNISMVQLQESLQRQAKPLSDKQRKVIETHPTRSAAMLRSAGIQSEDILTFVSQHHERIDGQGYPNNLSQNDIREESRILAIVDRYSAMVSRRAYRDPMSAQDVLKELFLKKGEECDERLSLLFIRELGIYPPGTFVRLKTGEEGIVIRRGIKAMHPLVSCHKSAKGDRYARPIRRDTNMEEYRIKDTLPIDPGLHLSLSAIWGYR